MKYKSGIEMVQAEMDKAAKDLLGARNRIRELETIVRELRGKMDRLKNVKPYWMGDGFYYKGSDIDIALTKEQT